MKLEDLGLFQTYAGDEGYPVIRTLEDNLPDEVQDELEVINYKGQIANPEYCPFFAKWLEEQGLPTDICYFVWSAW